MPHDSRHFGQGLSPDFGPGDPGSEKVGGGTPPPGSEGPTLDPSSTARGRPAASPGALRGGPTPGMSSMDSLGEKVGAVIGPYHLLSVIGEGGFGVVWVAEQREPISRRVALKVIKPGMDTRAVVARFEQERQALALMDHPNVARVFDAGATPEGRPYFAMEYVQGVPITDFCDRGNLSVRDRLELFIPICEAVQHAHSKGIIHRDIKPSNVLVEVVDGNPVPKVIDFGVAKAISHTLTEKTLFTELGQIVGTPEYMSPEQAGLDAIDVDTRTDVYSLGVLLYELLTGSLPFDSRSLRSAGYAEIQRIIREVDPPHPNVRLSAQPDSGATSAARRSTQVARLAGELRRELEWIPLKAMRKERDERYRTPIELAEDVRNYLNGKPLAAGPESAVYRARKFVRRNRAGVSVAGVVLASLVVGLGAATYGLVEARRGYGAARAAELAARQEAERATKEAARAEGVNRLWEQLLANAAPGVSGKIDLPLSLVLKVAADAVRNHRYVESPEVEAGVRAALGVAYRGLGRFKEAEDQLTKAVEAERGSSIRSDARLGRRLSLLAGLYLFMGKAAQAKPLVDEAAQLLGPSSDAPLRDRVSAVSNQARYCEVTGDFDGAQKLYDSVQELIAGSDRGELGQEEWLNVQARAELALRVGRTQEGVKLFRDALEDLRQSTRGMKVFRADALRGLAAALRQAGEWDEGAKAARESIAITDEAYGTPNAFSAWSQRILGGILRDLGQTAEAEQLERSSLEFRKATFGAQTLVVAQSLDGWAGTLVDLGCLPEAEAAFREAVEIRKKVQGENSVDVAIPLTGLADVLTRENKGAEAVEIASRALELRERSLVKNHWMIASTRSILGAALTAAGQFDQAETQLLGAYEAMKNDPGAVKRRLPDTIDRLIRLYEATNRPAEAEKWRSRRAVSKPATP